MRLIFIPLILFVITSLQAQELYQTFYEKGYIKDGMKYSVWQYFDLKQEPELVINHSTGKVMFISKDTSDYIIHKNGEWVSSRLDIHPVPLEGSNSFYRALVDSLKYPPNDLRRRLEGNVLVQFEIDTLGSIRNCSVTKGSGGECDSVVLGLVRKTNLNHWIPAKHGGKKYPSRFSISFEFRFEPTKSNTGAKQNLINDSKLLRQVIVTPKNVTFSDEEQAEFPGGMEALARHLAKNLKYPLSAARMGLEGKVWVKFIVEPDGSITNLELVRGFDVACNREAVRVVSIMPKWKPGKVLGKNVRSTFTQVIMFKLEH